MKTVFNKIKDYFTANICRKVFLYSVLAALALVIVNIFLNYANIMILAAVCLVAAVAASLIDTMLARITFRRKIYDMQVEHFESQAENGETMPTPAFSLEENSYLKKKNSVFVWFILLKTVIIIILFVLLFNF
jgi:hypothetical protein